MPTLLALRVGFHTLVALAFFAQMRRYPTIGGPGWWALSALAAIVGSIGFWFRDSWPDAITYGVGNASLGIAPVLAWLGLPPLLKWQLQKQAGAVLGRVVTVDAVAFTPWTLELTVTGLRVATAVPDSEPGPLGLGARRFVALMEGATAPGPQA